MSETRNVDADYLQARIADHAAYLRAGQSKRAAQVAQVLSDAHGYDVNEQHRAADVAEPEAESPELETAVAEPMPEAAVEPKPVRRPGRPRSAGK